MNALESLESQTEMSANNLPAIVDAATFTATPLLEPPQVVNGILHRGSKAVFGGPSKAFKSWTLLDLCLAVSTGGEWLGFETTPGAVLYVNLELQLFAIHKRLLAIANARRCSIPPTLRLWNLRGFSRPLSLLLPDLLRQIKGEDYALIVPDPIYKTLAGRNESDMGAIGEVCGEIEAVAVDTGAAVTFGAHFAKGNAASKVAIDRISGSGVWARDPDSIITCTTHEQAGAFSVEMTLRNFPPQEPFVIRWQYPRMTRDGELDPARLKQPKNGRMAEHTVSDIMAHLTDGMRTTAWLKECEKEAGISARAFYRLKKAAATERSVVKDGKAWRKRQHFGAPAQAGGMSYHLDLGSNDGAAQIPSGNALKSSA